MGDDEQRTCSRCGESAGADSGGLPEGWSLASDRRGLRVHCAACARSDIRAIEGKLDEEWWDR